MDERRDVWSWRSAEQGGLLQASSVERADDTEGAAINDMGIDHGRPQILVTEKALNGPDVGTRFKKVGRKAVAKGVTGGPHGESCRSRRVMNGALYGRFVEVLVSPDLA